MNISLIQVPMPFCRILFSLLTLFYRKLAYLHSASSMENIKPDLQLDFMCIICLGWSHEDEQGLSQIYWGRINCLGLIHDGRQWPPRSRGRGDDDDDGEAATR